MCNVCDAQPSVSLQCSGAPPAEPTAGQGLHRGGHDHRDRRLRPDRVHGQDVRHQAQLQGRLEPGTAAVETRSRAARRSLFLACADFSTVSIL